MQTGRSYAAHFEDDASREAYFTWSAAQMLVYNVKGTAKYYLPRSKASWNRLRMSSTKTQLASMSE